MGKGKWVARQAHNLKVGGSNPSPATNSSILFDLNNVQKIIYLHYIFIGIKFIQYN
jgi:hypothetical protein